jgi:hypothetical protein
MKTLPIIKAITRTALTVWLSVVSIIATADARVFTLSTPNPEAVLKMLQTNYGNEVRADLIQQRLVVVGATKQLDEIGTLLARIDRAPAPLHLTLREQPPPTAEQQGTVVYSSGDDGYTVDTVEGAMVAVEYQQIVQQPVSNGWLIQIENQPQTIRSLTLQVQLQNNRTAQILVSFSNEENQQRRIFGATLSGEIGAWIPLLPQPNTPNDGTISSGPKRGQQLYLRIEKNSARKVQNSK